MNYEKKYEEALERAKKELPSCGNGRAKMLERIFPELKESEDERIRKDIIVLIKDWWDRVNKDNISTKEQMIAWLEKQGEQKPDEEYNITGISSNKSQGKLGEIIKNLNLANKVEPKFKVGDWVVYDKNRIGVIVRLLSEHYIISFDGREEQISFAWEQNIRKWTIQDAKNGDVLWHSDSASNGIFIFKEIRYVDGKVLCYCDYDSEDHFCTGEHHTCCWSNAKYIKPATKEQRDTLEKAMTDAGYIFDFDKKELKKIENPIAWREEDEDYINDLIKYFSQNERLKNTKEDIVIWLKSLKDRIQPKQEWDTVDERMLQGIIDDVKQHRLLNEYQLGWLSELRPQNKWKPSNEQMKALAEALSLAKNCGEESSFDLRTLYEQLKKL